MFTERPMTTDKHGREDKFDVMVEVCGSLGAHMRVEDEFERD